MTTLFLLALALSMDAFAAALSRGATTRLETSDALVAGLAFGVAQGLMPLIGWGLGLAFTSIVRDVDHWIAFALLSLIGVRMAQAGMRQQPPSREASRAADWRGLATTAIATSVDAAAAGVTLPMLEVPVLVSCAIIGAVTFVLSTAGGLAGAAAGALLGRRAEVLGGLVLIGLGVKILVEHLFLGA